MDEKLNPEIYLKSYKPKINYLINRFRIIPKKSITLVNMDADNSTNLCLSILFG